MKPVPRSYLLLPALWVACASAPAPEPAEAPPAPPAAPTIAPRTVSIPDPAPRPPALRLLESTRFTLNVQDGDLPALLLGLGRDSPLNVVVDPDVQGRVTADLKDTSLLEILDQLVLARGYRYSARGNLLRIFRTGRETRTYRVDYPSYVRESSSDLLLAGLISSAPETGGGESSSSSSSESSEDVSLSSVSTQQNQDFWTEVEQAVRTLVFGAPDVSTDPEEGTGGEGGAAIPLPRRRVIVSRQAGLVTVTAESATLDEVEDYLASLASSLDRQVLIDATIIEVTLQDDLDLGVSYEIAPSFGKDTMGVLARSIVPGLREATIAQALAPVLEEGGLSFGLARDNLSVLIRALSKQTDVRVLSTPRVATLNNHAALIKVVRNEVFFIAEVETEVVEAVGTTQTVEFVPQIVPIGVTLDVTPQVSDDSEITLHIHPSVSEVVSTANQPATVVNGVVFDQVGSLPVIDLRETDTVLRVRDGATVVIGGLVRSREFAQHRRVPLLGDIPLLGYAFRSSDTAELRTELLIFLTPTLLDPPRVARVSDDLMDAFEEVDALRGERALVAPWWRRPFGRSYGATP